MIGHRSSRWRSAFAFVLACTWSAGVAVGAPFLYVANQTGNTVSSYSITGASLGNVVPGSAFNTPYSLALDLSGNLFVSDYGNQRVVEFSPQGVQLNVFNTDSLSNPRGLTVDPAGNLYVVNANGNIEKFVGGVASSIATITNPRGIAYFGGLLYVSSSITGNITTMTTSGGSMSTIATALGSTMLRGLVFDRSGNLYVADSGSSTNDGAVYKFAAGSTTPTLFLSNLAGPNDLDFGWDDNLYIAMYFCNEIHSFSMAGTDLGSFITGLSNPSGVVGPVPEPATIGFVGVGLLTFVAFFRRRR